MKTNSSIKSAFERMWMHILSVLSDKTATVAEVKAYLNI